MSVYHLSLAIADVKLKTLDDVYQGLTTVVTVDNPKDDDCYKFRLMRNLYGIEGSCFIEGGPSHKIQFKRGDKPILMKNLINKMSGFDVIKEDGCLA